MKPLLIMMLMAILALVTTACGRAQPAAAARGPASTAVSAPKEVTVTATEMAFTPAKIELASGQPVKLTLKNNGMTEHTWQVQLGTETIVVSAQPRQSASTTFTPAAPGTYRFVCNIPGHEPAGMVGTLVVS
jgi:uncharacterized cupredoxin-like copper-binding protein